MKKLKLLLILLLTLSLLPACPTFAADLDVEVEVEAIQINTTDVYKKLVAFGVISETDAVLSAENITRAQFIKYVMKCSFDYALDPAYITTNNPFADVTEATDGAAEIVTAYSLGIISGGTSFRPDAPITKNEAAKILVSVLGYSEVGALRGGYPAGYLAVAEEHDIFEGCSFTAEGYIPAYDFLTSLLNTLETDVLKVGSIHEGEDGWSTRYTNRKKTTLLEKTFGIYKEEGIVETNKYTSINGHINLNGDRVEIGGIAYEKGATDADELLGYNVEAYYTLDNSDTIRTLVYAEPYNNKILTVEDVDIARDEVTLTRFVYYKDGAKKNQKEKIDISAALIYNGGVASVTVDKLCPTNGFVTLIDNNEDEEFDVIQVKNYRTIKVDAVSSMSYKVVDDITGDAIVLDPADPAYDVKIEFDGKPADFTAIAEDNIISYAESAGNEINVKEVIVSVKMVEGVISQKSEDRLTIEDEEYPVDPVLAAELNLKDYYNLYIDFRGKIVAKKTNKDVVYGYLNDVISVSTLTDIVKVQIFTENNRWVELQLNDKILYNGSTQPASKFYQDWVNGIVGKELITYNVDSSNYVSMITLAQQFTPFSPEEAVAIEEGIFRKYDMLEEATHQYTTGIRLFKGEFVVNSKTKVFMVPEDGDKAKFSIASVDDFSDSENFTNVIPYDLNGGRIAGAIVMPAKEDTITNSSSFMVVHSMVRTMNSNGEAVNSIKGFYKGSLFTLSASSDDIYNETVMEGEVEVTRNMGLEPGDVVLFTFDVDRNIGSINRIYDLSATANSARFFVKNTSGTDLTVPNIWRNMVHVGGEIFSVDAESSMLVADVLVTDGVKEKAFFLANNNSFITIYDVANNTLEVGSLADIETGSRFVARVGYHKITEIIVFVNEE